MPDKVGRQELEVVLGDEHISFTTSKIGSLIDIEESKCVRPFVFGPWHGPVRFCAPCGALLRPFSGGVWRQA